MTNFSHICIAEDKYMLHGTPLEYIFPPIAVFGILGNALNLTVLLNKSMRSRANHFLAVLAFADIIVLSLMLPNALVNFKLFGLNYYYRWIYFSLRMPLIATANWSSAVAIWCIISVCADRLWGIRNPLYARDAWPGWKMPFVIFIIVATTGLFTLYQYFEYICPIREYCNNTQIFSKCLHITADVWFGSQPNPLSRNMRNFFNFCVMVYPLVMIIFPIILLAVLNMMLICALRRRQQNLLMGGHCSEPRRSMEASNFAKTEHRVTLTVTFIVTMFTVTNGPSALEHLVRKAYNLQQNDYYDVTMICTTLVIFGKASNFILFCLGSKHFRLRLIKLTQKKVNKKIGGVSLLHANVRALFTVLIRWHGKKPRRENFSTTFLDRPSFRRSSLPNKHKPSNSQSSELTSKISIAEKRRTQSKPSLGVRGVPTQEQLRMLSDVKEALVALNEPDSTPRDRGFTYEGPAEMKQPLIANDSL